MEVMSLISAVDASSRRQALRRNSDGASME
jgi:hypothetical protein